MFYKKGDIIKAKVTAIKHYGAFIETRDGTQGLIHISEIANNFIVDINYYLKVGEIIEVKVLTYKDGKINGSLNFSNRRLIKKSSDKYVDQLQSCHFKYGFKTLEENLYRWQKYAEKEMYLNKK
ncbi:S1 RNA-binding domain-containing protein [Gemella sp. GH3]|uniref:S1 RNA-binding domain-containing protein n=1 Tax=unclassified Gemella TaxID=2624949 RepID=UPI0015D0A605|nr:MULTISPECIES: S1 RNA-binding domain-containing protein [unclassified Gemella]MBF0713982.1 S1 RNA-binding domain-containing protein [Gemella sp. GH3.1]NYS50934.1 S1 RNA-binding domain-containing protein [Gemella sp. GH3]